MSTIERLRPYQTQAIAALREAMRNYRQVVLTMPTGSGKTTVMASIVRSALQRGQRVLIIAHRQELILQAVARLDAAGVPAGIIMAGHPTAPHLPVQVGSVATLARRELPEADLIVVDEAHHATAKSYRDILDHYPRAHVIGLTATPERLDGQGLGDIFGILVESPSVVELVQEGHLVAPRVFAPATINTKGVRKQAGDFAPGALAKRAAKLTGDIVEHWKRLAPGRRTVCFACTCEHSRNLVEAFRSAGVPAEHLDAKTPTPEREAILSRLASGETQVLCNVGILTEGWDLPALEAVILARPTQSAALYLQMVGRVMRPAPGKDLPIVLDHAGATHAHGFVTDARSWSLEGRSKGGKQGPGVTTCPECYLTLPCGTRVCPSCGHVRPLPIATHQGVTVALGELQEMLGALLSAPAMSLGALLRSLRPSNPRKPTPAERARALTELAAFAKAKGYQPGWVAYRYRDIFGAFPRPKRKPKGGAA